MSQRVMIDPCFLQQHKQDYPFGVLVGIQDDDKYYVFDCLSIDKLTLETEQWEEDLKLYLQCLCRSLPCGFVILGFSYISHNTFIAEKLLSFQSILYTFMKESQNCCLRKHMLMLSIEEKKSSCKVIDIEKAERVFPCKVKETSKLPLLSYLETMIDLDWILPWYDKEQDCLQWFQEKIDSFCSSLTDGWALVNDQYVCYQGQPEDWYLPAGKQHQVQLFLKEPFPLDTETNVCDGVVRLVCQMSCRVYYLGKLYGNQILSSFQQDIREACYSMLQITLEEYGSAAFQPIHSKMVWHMPKRIFIECPSKKITYCDYILRNENKDELQLRLDSILHISQEEYQQTNFIVLSEKSNFIELPFSSLCSDDPKIAKQSKATTANGHWQRNNNPWRIRAILVVLLSLLLFFFGLL